MTKRRRVALSLVVVVVVLILPGGGPAAVPPSHSAAAPVSPLVHPVVGSVPAAFAQPWSVRSGFDPAYRAESTDVMQATGEVSVVVTLWPKDLSFYSPPPAGTAPLGATALADRYGVSPTAYLALEAYFAGAGLTVKRTFSDRLLLTVSGPAPSVGAAFGTTLLSGEWNGRSVTFPSSPAHLPAPFGAEVAAVSGLSTGFDGLTLPAGGWAPLAPAASPSTPSPSRTTNLVTPSAIHTIYGLDALYNYSGSPHYASNVGIALLLWGDGYNPNDITSFFQNEFPSGFPIPTVVPSPVDNASPPSATSDSDPSQAPFELTLDIEWAGSAAPGSTLYPVYAPDGTAANGYSPTTASMVDALNKAVHQLAGVKVISMSFGTSDSSSNSLQPPFDTLFGDAVNAGITLVAASGDKGGTSLDTCRGTADPQYPAASPDVLAVGGTAPVLSEDALGTVNGIASEPGWDRSGGGFSSDYSAPSWQEVGSARTPIGSSGFRGMPDVAAPAAFNAFFFNGRPAAGNGTSFGSPVWAGLVAEIDALRGTAVGFVTPRLYAIGAAQENHTDAIGLADIASGANCVASASTGWDEVTGWGSPRGLGLYEDLVATFVTVSLSAANSATPGTAYTVTATVAKASSGGALANVPVAFTLNARGFAGPCGGTLASAASNTSTNGNATAELTIPTCYLGTSATLSVLVLANGFYGTNSTIITVNLNGISQVLGLLQVFPYNVIGFALIILAAVGIGLKIGTWRRRRRQRNLRRPPVNPATHGDESTTLSRGPSAPGPSGPSGSSGTVVTAPPRPAVAPARPRPAPTSSSPSASPVESSEPPRVPDHLLATPTSIPPYDPATAGSNDRCPSCGASVEPSDTLCGSCGGALRAPSSP